MPSKADTAVVRTIGIDTGKNTLHMNGSWPFRENLSHSVRWGLPHEYNRR